jgi:hypothetical protein
MTTPLSEICCASIPATELAALAELRGTSDVRVALDGDRAWLRWPAEEEPITLRILSIRGAELYAERDGQWFRLGSRLPSVGWPAHLEARPLHDVLMPAPVEPEPVPATPLHRCRLHLVRDPRPRATTALRCAISSLASWADRATTAQLVAVGGIRLGNQVVLRGRNLPMLPGARRYWGERVLAPLGYRSEPVLPENALLAALGADDDCLAILELDGVELLPLHASGPLTRVSVRLALAERI